MAEIELEKGTRADVRALAQSMRDAQMNEITMLKNARQQIAGSSEIPSPQEDAHQEQDMAVLDAATGGEVD